MQVTDYRHGRVPRAVREAQILRLAEELFAERGYEGASMDELARRAGVTKPVIYDVVGSKDELFRRCFEAAGEDLRVAVAEAAAANAHDLRGLLGATALAFLRFIDEHEGAWAMLYSLDAGGRAAGHVRRIRTEQTQVVAQLLTAQARDVDPDRMTIVSYALNGAVEALGHLRHDQPDAAPEAIAEAYVDLIEPGLRRLLEDG